MDKAQLLRKANELPEQPGVYTMYDKTKKVIYVGKAVNLKNRVQSYFRNTDHGSKTNALVENADNFEVIITATELDALLTECSLIKQHNPFYNIKLKDGRGYPFIHLFIENGWPNLKLENSKTSNGRYFGPFVMRQNAYVLIDMIKKAFLLPQCSFKARKPDKLCLNYHIKRCAGYCIGKVSDETIQAVYNAISLVLEGDVDKIYKEVYSEMEKASDSLYFEEAVILRDKVKALEMIAGKQRPMVAQNRSADYIAYYEHVINENSDNPQYCCIFMLRIRNGYVIGERCDFFDESFTDELLNDYIERFYTDDNNPPNKIYIDKMYDWVTLVNQWLKDKVTIPTFSQDKDLLEIARMNATERMLQSEGRTKKGQRLLSAFCDFTGIEKADHIELYDISSIAGSDVVCGMT
ncbi:MAG: excinuclease subunit, partial [Clostridia bacterium]|nr:excinuclease subunit [Clostridia bacterium]